MKKTIKIMGIELETTKTLIAPDNEHVRAFLKAAKPKKYKHKHENKITKSIRVGIKRSRKNLYYHNKKCRIIR